MLLLLSARMTGEAGRPILAEMIRRLQRPFDGQPGRAVARSIRFGPDGVAEQYRAGVFIGRSGVKRPWPPTKRFGRRPPPRKTLVRRGDLRRAWLGLSGDSLTVIRPDSVSVGVRRSHQYAHVHQFGARIEITDRMRGYVGARWGAGWPSGQRYLRIPPRTIGINPKMIAAVGKILVHHIVRRRRT